MKEIYRNCMQFKQKQQKNHPLLRTELNKKVHEQLMYYRELAYSNLLYICSRKKMKVMYVRVAAVFCL